MMVLKMDYATNSQSLSQNAKIPNTEQPLEPSQFQALTHVSDTVMTHLEGYLDLLCRWQAKINLVGKSTLNDPWRRHFLDSAQLYPLLPKEARVIIDIGSGAGFPALVLALMDSGNRRFHLVESDQRKGTFLREIIRLTNIRATVYPLRAEIYNGPRADVVTARACAPLEKLLNLAEPLHAVGGSGLYLKGANYRDELTTAEKDWKMSFVQHPSLSDPSGVILQVEKFVRTNDG